VLWQWCEAELVYPGDRSTLDGSVPTALCANFWEAHVCFQNGAYKACALMCRTIVEGAATTFGATGWQLTAKLRYLRQENIISEKLHAWATLVLKKLGDDAAHHLDEAITREDANDALEFTRAILEYLYVLEAAFQRFNDRRTKAEQTP
jgi:hypothetical protein